MVNQGTKIHTIIVAAGSGSRFGDSLPKQFHLLHGIPVVFHAINNIRLAVPDGSETIVLAEEEMDRWHELCRRFNFSSPNIVAGGASRFHSVKNALDTLPTDVDIIMVHDGARPFAPKEMITNIVSQFSDSECMAAIPAIRITDSLREILPSGSNISIDRARLRAVQTPQAFRADLLHRAYNQATHIESLTDDASVFQAAGYSNITLVDGDPRNIKITNPIDISIAEVIDNYR